MEHPLTPRIRHRSPFPPVAYAIAVAAVALVASAPRALADYIPYSLDTTMAVPPIASGPAPLNPNPGGAFTSFDISYFDPVSNADYVADRSNAGVDIFSASSLSFIGRANNPADPFTGQQATTSASGPDGVVVANTGTQHTLFAGNGNSTLVSFNVSSPATPVPAFSPLNTGGTFRVDEMAFSPSTNLVLVANNADNPAFGTLVNATTGAATVGHIVVPGAVGLEQPVWDANTGSFFISVPQFGPNASDPGGLAEILPDGTVSRVFDFGNFGISSCSPTGLALGASGNLMVGCGNGGTQTVLFNPSANGGKGAIVTTFSQISGSDELYFDPGTLAFYVTGTTAAGRAFDVISDVTDSILQSVPLPNVNAHSISVDLLNNDVFVPLEGGATDALCPVGCVAVFAQVPEPAGIWLLLTGCLLLGGVGWLRRSSLYKV